MKIHEIIKTQRLAKNMTQEQLASYLGVSAPAVNKWERSISYPDITLLPALARVLDVDLNTLLSFQDDLSDQEIVIFLNHLSEIAQTKGFHAAYEAGMKKIKEYPTCYALLLHVAMQLDGTLLLDKKMKTQVAYYQEKLECIYKRVLKSEDDSLKNLAQRKLIQRYMEKHAYEKAELMIQQLPSANAVDKKQMQVKLCLAKEDYEEAARMEEERLLWNIQTIQETLLSLMQIALKQKRKEDAEYIAKVAKDSAEIFDLWEYQSYLAQFQLYTEEKHRIKSMKTLMLMLASLRKKWDIHASPLYRHIHTTPKDIQEKEDMSQIFVQALLEDEQTAFLKEDVQFQNLIKDIQKENRSL